MLCSLSRLEDKSLHDIQALEKDIGKTLLSFSCHDLKSADLKQDELQKIQALEDRLGIALVAVA